MNKSDLVSPKLLAQANSSTLDQVLVSSPTDATTTEQIKVADPASVMLNGDVLFELQTDLAGVSPTARARDTSRKIREIAEDNSIAIDDIKIVKTETFQGISANNLLLTVVVVFTWMS